MKFEELTVEQKLRLICGKDNWHTEDFSGTLPSVTMADASMGVRMPKPDQSGDKPSVAYPALQVLANTWNKDLAREYAECVADDCLDAGVQVLLGPGVNIKRNPLCGRNFEYFSEDPYLAGVLAREYVNGLQSEGVGACVKHFCANNLEFNRMKQTSEVDERTLREIYYKPFEIACEAKPLSVMCSYNKINGVQASEYKKGFDALRKNYGFDGLVMSDWGAVNNRAKAAKAGLDLEMPFSEENYKKLLADYESGVITKEEIDVCARRVLEFAERANGLRRGKKCKHSLQERIEFTQTVEEEGIVLLKNNGILPLVKGKRLSVCGAFAQPGTFGFGENPDIISGGGSARVVRLTPLYDIVELLKSELGGTVNYQTAYTENIVYPSDAFEIAAESDVSLLFVGTGAQFEQEAKDRESAMRLSDCVERMICDLAMVNPATVVVIFACAPIDMSRWIDSVAAAVLIGFPGERGGEAITNVLTGKVNPSGKLSETFPYHFEDTPVSSSFINGRVTRYDEGLNVGYRYYDTFNVPVLFPFGHGLSYSKFDYSGLELELTGDLSLKVRYKIENKSQLDGKEVSQIYIHSLSSCVYRPNKELKEFSKDLIAAGKTKTVAVELDEKAFTYWLEGESRFDVEDGIYEVLVAASVEDIMLSERIKIKDKKITLLTKNERGAN